MALPSVLPFQPQFNYPNNKMYQLEVYPVLLYATFTVDSTNALGISGLTGAGFANVFMHTSTTPGLGNYAVTNPNPANGLISIQLQNQFSGVLGFQASMQSPVTGSALTSVTSGSAYTIVSVGTTTTAQWVTRGLPVGVTPTAGQTFLATSTGALGGNGTVKIAGFASISHFELAGQPILVNSNVYQNGGASLLLQCVSTTPSGTVSAPVFTGDALATHNHNLIVKGGQIASTTNDVATYAGPLLGKQEASDATILGANSATNGGVVGASAGTPSGTNSAPTFTNTSAAALKAPTDGTVIRLMLYMNNSSVTVAGQ